MTKRTYGDGREVYFLLNHTQHPQQVALPAGTFFSLLDDAHVEGLITVAAMDIVILLQE